MGPTQPPVQWVPGLSPEGKEQPGLNANPSPPSSAVGHERVELYLYSPYGPYGLYRASVPVQGCTLPFLPEIIFCDYFPNLLFELGEIWCGRCERNAADPAALWALGRLSP